MNIQELMKAVRKNNVLATHYHHLNHNKTHVMWGKTHRVTMCVHYQCSVEDPEKMFNIKEEDFDNDYRQPNNVIISRGRHFS